MKTTSMNQIKTDPDHDVWHYLYWDEPAISSNKEQTSDTQQLKHDEELLEVLYLEYVVEFDELDLRAKTSENERRIFKNKLRYYASKLHNAE